VSAVLRSAEELVAAEKRARQLGLCPVPDRRKYWDNLLALDILERSSVNRSTPVVDLGCRSGILLTWLHQRGYRQLYGCDMRRPFPPLKSAIQRREWTTLLAGARMHISHVRRMRRASIESTGFPSETFAAALCMSVIEHGVDLRRFFDECSRILRPKGFLVLSTDYWPESVDLRGLRRFVRPDRIFDRAAAGELCRIAAEAGLHLRDQPSLDAHEPVIEADGFKFTFLLLEFDRV
jgi:SAM-dependent methyltransferase